MARAWRCSLRDETHLSINVQSLPWSSLFVAVRSPSRPCCTACSRSSLPFSLSAYRSSEQSPTGPALVRSSFACLHRRGSLFFDRPPATYTLFASRLTRANFLDPPARSATSWIRRSAVCYGARDLHSVRGSCPCTPRTRTEVALSRFFNLLWLLANDLIIGVALATFVRDNSAAIKQSLARLVKVRIAASELQAEARLPGLVHRSTSLPTCATCWIGSTAGQWGSSSTTRWQP